jgi:hypothetical protein
LEGEIEREERESQTPQLRAPPMLPRLPGPKQSPLLSPPLAKPTAPKHTPPPPKPLQAIPLIPVCACHIGQQTKLVIDLLWREHTGGLWMCRCSVCVRAVSVQGVPLVSAGGIAPVASAPQPIINADLWGGGGTDVAMEVQIEGKGKGVAGRRSRERDGDDYAEWGAGERKRMKCEGS